MNDFRSDHHVYSIFASRSRAIIVRSLFSSPSPLSFEKGRLLGSAQTRNTRAAFKAGQQDVRLARTTNLRKAEDIKHPSSCCVVRQVCHCIDEAEGRGSVFRIESACDDRAGPTPDAR